MALSSSKYAGQLHARFLLGAAIAEGWAEQHSSIMYCRWHERLSNVLPKFDI